MLQFGAANVNAAAVGHFGTIPLSVVATLIGAGADMDFGIVAGKVGAGGVVLNLNVAGIR